MAGGEWRKLRVEDFAEVIGGGTPSTKDETNFNGEIPWITPKDLSDYQFRYISRGERNISEKGLNNSNAKLLPAGSVLLTTRAPVGYVVIAANPLTTNQGFHSLVPKEGFSSEFIYYLLKANTEYLKANASGTTFSELSGQVLKKLVFYLPPLHEQRAIAHILGTLDDKIELNQRMSQTLEAMARALFKAWFVDFEPVRAKCRGDLPGRPRWQRGESLPGLPAHLYDLFPDRLVDSELGEIPEGWEVETLGDYCINFDSKRVPLSGRDRANRKGPFPYYGAAGVLDYVDDYLFDGIYLLVGEDGSVMREDGLGVTQYVWGKFWVNNHAHVLQGKPPVSTEQLYFYFDFESVAPHVTGAVQPKLSQGRMNTMPFLFAGEEVCLEFHRLVEPWFARIRACAEESRTLAALRDTLLPKLISGELWVGDAERFLKERDL
ncbi:MAG: restriction endonuclease subunit S [Anaerolineae bacterium]|jgi:type I restriction enzyme S subunit|nr:MAG: restriction endonuclease subunit S [Anaerolineae bacterium]